MLRVFRFLPVAVLGAAPMAALLIVCARSPVSRSGPATAIDRATIDGLPAAAGAAPVLTGEDTELSSDEARARNAAVPFLDERLLPARPFRFSGSAQDRTRALDCLALAAMAEAGASDAGQRAVMQVILNRVRHPAFARTICGVVFEGAERSTGCQFTFTCDGSLDRAHAAAAWAQARRRAGEALAGKVFAAVGNATHYHTDWVYPWWSPQLVKLARVDTHLFFRWPGYWGSAAAGKLAYRGGRAGCARACRTGAG